MDPLDFKTNEELLLFFHRKKTKISCIEQPDKLLTQLRDHDLVPEKLFENVKKMRTRKQKGFYDILDWLEKNRPHDIRQFWRCVFEDHILQWYQTLRVLRNSLMDNPTRLCEKPSDVETEEESEGKAEKGKERDNKRKRSKDDRRSTFNLDDKPPDVATPTEEKQSEGKAEKQKKKSYKRKKSKDDRSSEDSDDPDLFSAFTPASPQKKGDEQENMNEQFPVSSNKRSSKVEKRDAEKFQEQGGRGRGTEFKGGVEEEEEEEDMADLSVFQTPSLPVTCVSLTGTLYKNRFASGSRGKCIRTEERWFTPEEFVKQEQTLTNGHWKKDILCHGKTLNFLLKKEILLIHSILCECGKCSTEEEDMMAQNNDDECYVCCTEGDLVCCDECPRAFHSHCHLPAADRDSPGKWICTFCELKGSQQWCDPSMSEQEALSAPVSQYILHCHCLLLCVCREVIDRVFVEDPRKRVPRYSEFITQPMWLDRIKQKLESGEYQTVEAFVSDIQLIFSNSTLSRFGQMGARLKEMFEEAFQKIFSIKKKGLVEESDPEDFQKQGGRGGGTEFKGGVEEEEEEDDMADLSVFQRDSLPVTCVSLTGTLYKYRFMSGSRGKCIRTEERWFTPEEFVKQEQTLTDGHWKKDILCHGKTLNFLLKKEILRIRYLLRDCEKYSTHEMAQNNDDECYVCHSEGDLVCCDECPRAFHFHCHLPAVDRPLPRVWICTYCELRNSQQVTLFSNMSEQEAFSARVSQYILHCHYLLLCVYREDIQKVFFEDPHKTVPRYSEFITRPMWLDRIKQKLESGAYWTVGAFASDVRLIFSNCSTFNRDNVFGQMGARLEKMFEEEFQKIFSIKNAEVFTPIVQKGNNKDKHKNEYRFECPYAGEFRCSQTSLVFVMKGEGEVQYKTASWDPRLLDGLGNMKPAGPLYDIDCFDGSISGLHLPHCEEFSEKDMDCLAVAHFTGGNVAIMDPLNVTDAHVVIDIKDLSLFGLIKRMIFSPSSVIAQVLVFLRPITERQNILDVHLLPGNVPLSEVKDQHVENMHIKTSSKCCLTPGTEYRLCCRPERALVQPLTEVFELNFGPNYHPTFEVFVNVKNKVVTLSLMDNIERREAWLPRRILLTVTSGQEVELPVNRSLTESEFVNKHRHHLIQRVSSVMAIADGLRAKDMITAEIYSKVCALKTPQDRMRLLLDACDSGGASVKAEFYRLLKENEPHLVNDLDSEHNRPQ